jgi:hypothetical protein
MAVHRPYANSGLPSVTQVLSLLSAPGLPWGAARETAKYAVHHLDQWRDLRPEDAVDTLYRHHRGVWDHRALLGTALHQINAEWCQGHTVKVIDVIQELRHSSRLWRQKPETDIYRDLLPMADGLARVWERLKPETLSWEQCVRYRNPIALGLDYVGTTDWRAVLDGEPFLLDLKTTGNTKLGAGKYWDQWRLQLAAYRYCTEAVVYDCLVETDILELPPVAGCVIVHLYGDGEFQVDGIQAGPAEHEIFLALRKAYGWRKDAEKSPGRNAPIIVGAPA